MSELPEERMADLGASSAGLGQGRTRGGEFERRVWSEQIVFPRVKGFRSRSHSSLAFHREEIAAGYRGAFATAFSHMVVPGASVLCIKT